MVPEDIANQKPIAERTLQISEGAEERDVIVRVYAPEPADPSFACTFTIDGLPQRVRDTAHGADSLQSIIMALTGMQRALAPYRESLSLFGQRREHGIPAIPPVTPDPEQNIFIADLIERETEHYLEIALLPKGRHRVQIPDDPSRTEP